MAGSSDFVPAHACAGCGESAINLPAREHGPSLGTGTERPVRQLPSTDTGQGLLTPVEKAGLTSWFDEARDSTELALATAQAVAEALALLNAEALR